MDKLKVRLTGPICYLLWSSILALPFFFIPGRLKVFISAPFLISFVYLYRAMAHKEAVTGLEIVPDSEPVMKNLIDAIAIQLGVRFPDYLVIGCSPDFFILEDCLINGRPIKGRVLHLSYPAMLILESDELSTMLRHEIYHLGAQELKDLRTLKTGTHLFKCFRKSSLPGSKKIVGMFSHQFLLSAGRISRALEKRADDQGRSFNEISFNSGLLKISFLRFIWARIEDEAKKINEFNLRATTYLFFQREALMESFLVRVIKASAHEYDTHPLLKERLEKTALSSLERKDETSLNLFLHGEEIEQAINAEWRKSLLETHPIL